ncbi:hypothetical protein ACHAWF_016200 [Thalassiosira exigua]
MAADKGSSSGYGAASSSSAAPTNVQVIAPATLAAGYTFDAMFDGTTFTVTVPEGGVVKGQRFIVPFAPAPLAVAVAVPGEPSAPPPEGGGPRRRGHGAPPTGIWRDGLCDCFRHGPCHPSLLYACFFRTFLVGQVLTRTKMTWLGQGTGRGGDGKWRDTFRNVVLVTLLFFVVRSVTATPVVDAAGEPLTYYDLSFTDRQKYSLNSLATSLFGIYVIYIMVQLRATIRHVYSIPEENCTFWYQLGVCGSDPREGICGSGDEESRFCAAGVPVGWEDVCCALWCQLCIAAQMARHTVDYDEKRAKCCNSTGVRVWDDDEAYEGVPSGVGEGSVLVV